MVGQVFIHFNHGLYGRPGVYRNLNVETGTHNVCFEADTNRIIAMEGKSSTETILRRKYLRAVRKRYIDIHKEAEGETYASGYSTNFVYHFITIF